MDVRTLGYFVAVAEEQSFTRAAARCLVAQPSLSQQIRALEREIGEPLFDRGPRSTTLTSAGRALLPYARDALAAVSGAKEEFAYRAGGLAGEVRIGLVDGIDTDTVGSILAAYTSDHSRVRLTIIGGTSIDLTQRVAEGRLEVAVVARPIGDLPPHLAHRDVYREEVVAIRRATGRRSRAVTTLPVSDLADAPVITYNDASGVHPHIAKYLHEHGVTPQIICSTNDPALHRALAGNGLGTAITATADPGALAGPQLAVAVLDPPLWLDKALIWQRHTSSRAVAALVDRWR